jgi:FkbM family methyltransferase
MRVVDSRALRRSREAVRKARKLRHLVPDPLFRQALRHGVAAAVEHDDVAFEHDFGSVIDVGAHTGQFALFAARRFPEASIACFEPFGPARERLQAVLRSHPRLTIYPSAAGARAETRELHVTRDDDSSSLLPITERAIGAFPGTEEVATVATRTVRLDETVSPSNMRRPALLKIDVQGYELEVLRGAERLLPHVDEILVEVSFLELYEGQPTAADVVTFLAASGFDLNGVFGVTRDGRGRCLQADFLFSLRVEAE